DAFHRTAPEPEGLGASEAIRLALVDAKINPEQVAYINAHGTATYLNDPAEVKAVKRVFGDYAYQVPLRSTKSMMGHSMGATAAMEAVFTVLAIRDNVAPPTIHLDNPAPDCDLDFIPHQVREIKMDYAMSNSFGFGGHNASLVFKRFND